MTQGANLGKNELSCCLTNIDTVGNHEDFSDQPTQQQFFSPP